MFLFKLIQAFILPGVFSGTFLLFGLLLLLLKRKRWGRFFLILATFCYFLFSSTPFANLLIGSLEGRNPPLKENQLSRADRVVLLLGGGESNVLRAAEALRLFHLKEGDLEIVVSGRDPLDSSDQSGRVLKNFLVERGLPSERIRVEEGSRNTFENARETRHFVREEPFFLVTSAYHMPRSEETFRSLGMSPIPAPTDFKQRKCCNVLDFFPSASNLLNSDRALHEYFGLWYYELKYF